MFFLYLITYPVRHPTSLWYWPWQRRRKLTPVGLYVAFVVALSYRPGHPWAGLIGGTVAIFILFAIVYVRVVIAQYNRLKEN